MSTSFVHYQPTDTEQSTIRVVCIQPGLHHIVSIFPDGHEVFIGEVEKVDKEWSGYVYTGKGMGWAHGPTGNERLRHHGYRIPKHRRYLKDAVSAVMLSAIAYHAPHDS